MPTANRQQWVRAKARQEFRGNKDVCGPELGFLIQLAEVQLDNLLSQQQHLNTLKQQGNLKS